MKTLLAASLLALISTTAFAQTADQQQPQQPQQLPQPQDVAAPQSPCVQSPQVQPCAAPAVALAEPQQQPVGATPSLDASNDDDTGWHKPVGRRFFHGFRMGWTYIQNINKMNRTDDAGMPTSLAKQYGLKSPNMMLLGYEGFYRIVGHSWLNVLMVGNVTVAGLEQSKFIPAASGLIGFEFNKSFQLGVGVNLTPDPAAISHMIAAAGWTPMVGSIQTPIHFFYVPDTNGNHRMGATVGMTW